VVFAPWDSWDAIFQHALVQILVQILLLVLLVAGAPAAFVITTVIWVGAALTGDLQDSLRVWARRVYSRRNGR
jgi:hypothetical protein